MTGSDANTSRQSALVVIDVQRALFEKRTPVYHADALLRNIASLVDRAHAHGCPVFVFRHSNQSFLAHGSDGWQLHPAFNPTAADILLDKQHGSAFVDPSFQQQLQARGVHRLVVTGLVSNGCVKATCEDALKLGYAVALVEDGHSSYHKDAAQIIEEWNRRLSASGVEVVAADAVDFRPPA